MGCSSAFSSQAKQCVCVCVQVSSQRKQGMERESMQECVSVSSPPPQAKLFQGLQCAGPLPGACALPSSPRPGEGEVSSLPPPVPVSRQAAFPPHHAEAMSFPACSIILVLH